MTKINLVLIGALMILLMLTGCSSNTPKDNLIINKVADMSSSERIINIDKLEIYHFHAKNQCYSCIAVGDLAEETVNTYFKEELENGIIIFKHINGELPENRELVIKYGATGSSLWLGTYSGDEFKAEQNTNVWYKINNKKAYTDYLKEVIEQKLAGN